MAIINNELANILLAGLRLKGFEAGVMGGYARDTFFGRVPKDMDICVAVGPLRDEDVEVIISKLSNLLFNIAYENGFRGLNRKVMGMYNDHASDRACGVVQYPDDGIDIIFYRDCRTCDDIIQSFDFNLNQFGMLDNGECAYYGDTDLRTLTPVRKDASPKRCIKVVRKHSNLLSEIDRAYSEGRLV